MKFTNPFSSRRRTEQLDVRALTFLGEQDGPPERMLKGRLSELFKPRENVLRAYLARVHYGDPKTVSVCLCLDVKDAPDEPLVEAVHSLFARHFNRAVHLDTLFLKPKQEEQLAIVCKPFYQSQ
jgi:hypothetical protein